MQRTHLPGPGRGGLRRWATLVAFVVVSAAAQLATASTAEAASVQVSPSTVESGDSVQISGDGFAPVAEVRLCLDNERCTNLGTATPVDGGFSTTGTIPGDTGPGSHTIHACQRGLLGGWTCASGAVQVASPQSTTTTTQPTTTTTQPTTTTTQPTTTTTRPTTTTTRPTTTTTNPPRTTTTQPPTTSTTSPTTSTPSESPPSTNTTDPTTTTQVEGGDVTTTAPASTTTSEAGDDTTTTTVEDEVLALGPESAPPQDGAPTPPAEAGAPTGDEARTSAGAGGLFGLELHHWVLLVLVPVLALTVLWLVDHFGIRNRRTRHLFLESVREWRR